MSARDEWLWVALGLGVLVLAGESIEWGDPLLWTFPVPDLIVGDVQFPATLSQEYRYPSHVGVDVDYRRPTSPLSDVLKSEAFNDKGTSAKWFTPQDTPVLAARAGKVWEVTPSPRGLQIVIDHGAPWLTYYQHLVSASVKAGDVVKAGDRIGTMGADPTDPEGLRHLHFECWYKRYGSANAVDPYNEMAKWRRVQWTQRRT